MQEIDITRQTILTTIIKKNASSFSSGVLEDFSCDNLGLLVSELSDDIFLSLAEFQWTRILSAGESAND